MTTRWSAVSTSPTLPVHHAPAGGLTASDLFTPPVAATVTLDEKLRRAYFWLINKAVISPFYDVEFGSDTTVNYPLGDAGASLSLPKQPAYSSNVLVPLLTFAVGGRCLLIGGPGRGKTTLAVLMGVLAGSKPADVRRHVQQGQPQLTVGDLVGIPLPRDLVQAGSLAEITIAWKSWLTAPVKIVDEYNRIPTKTQSALLTMVAEGYVESHDQMHVTAPENGVQSWFFTANDDGGGGTFPVIQALRDRIDVTVQAFGFNSRFLDELVSRVEAGDRPEDNVPAELMFTAAEQAAMVDAIRAIPVPTEVRRRLEFFVSHFEFVQHGGRRFEYRTKDVVATAGLEVEQIIEANSGADLQVDLGAQTVNGVSVRSLQNLVLYAKALAWFRGNDTVTLEDVRAMVPFALRGKLLPNSTHPRFDTGADRELASDPASWLTDLFDTSCRQYVALAREDEDPVAALLAQFDRGLDGVHALEVSRRLTTIEARISTISGVGKIYGRDFDDLVACKYLYQRYSNYLHWLENGR